MVDLILLNGPPASGKSTIAAELVGVRPLALNLDVDIVRGLLGHWLAQPAAAGIAARRLALAMAQEHLNRGFDVIVPQLVTREEFAIDLENTARECGARFVEVALIVDRDDAHFRFAQRKSSEVQAHRDAQALVNRLGDEAVGEMYDSFTQFIASRPTAKRVIVEPDDIPETYRRVEQALTTG